MIGLDRKFVKTCWVGWHFRQLAIVSTWVMILEGSDLVVVVTWIRATCVKRKSHPKLQKKSFLDHLPTILNRKKNYERHQPLTCTSCHVNCIIPNCINTIIMFNILLYCWMDCHSFSHLQIDNSILIEPRVCLLWSIFYGRKQKMGKRERSRDAKQPKLDDLMGLVNEPMCE